MVYLNVPYRVLWGSIWVNKVSVCFLQQLDPKNKNKTWVQLYLFDINGFIFVSTLSLGNVQVKLKKEKKGNH